MSPVIDPQAVNHSTVALSREMTPQGRRRPAESDTLFIGTPPASETDHDELRKFGLSKNYQLVVATFDPADPDVAPASFLAVLTDGLTITCGLAGGRLWKKDRQSASILLFPDARVLLKMSSKGRLIIREMKGPYGDHGYELARASLLSRANRKPGRAPVVAPVGTLVTVLDITTLQATFQAA